MLKWITAEINNLTALDGATATGVCPATTAAADTAGSSSSSSSRSSLGPKQLSEFVDDVSTFVCTTPYMLYLYMLCMHVPKSTLITPLGKPYVCSNHTFPVSHGGHT